MNKVNSNKLAIIFASIIAIFFIGIVTLVVSNNKTFESSLSVVPTPNIPYMECNCFNCTNHTSGYIPPITLKQIQGNHNLDWPEELPSLGDTIALTSVGDSTYMCYYHLNYPQEYYQNWSIYIISKYPE